MTDTICPRCGFDNRSIHDYCPCGYNPTSKFMVPEFAAVAAMHRIRELEARIRAKDDALKDIAVQKLSREMGAEEYEYSDFEGGYISIVELAREALKK